MSIYLDNLAATPVDPRVAARHRMAMISSTGNAHSSEHAAGAAAQRSLDDATTTLLRAVGSDVEDVTFTPGASSALWLAVEDAIARTASWPSRIAATAVEHPALLSTLRRAERDGRVVLTLIPVDRMGAPALEAVEHALSLGVDLLCTMAANNEVGTISDIGQLRSLATTYGARHLVDASQAAGRVDMRDIVDADLVVISGAKIYGPRRVGALIGEICGRAGALAHDVFGSPDTAAATALAYAAELRAGERDEDEPRIARMRDALELQLRMEVPGLQSNGDSKARLAGSLHVSSPHVSGDVAVARLWGRVAVSTGAACQSGVPGPSHVLSAMDIPEWARTGAMRIGIGKMNCEQDVMAAGALIAAALAPAETNRMYA